jgi:DNA replication protein DnaC
MKKSTAPASVRDLCLNHFKILGIPIPPNDLDAALERADKETLSHLKFLDLLLGQQAAARRDRSVERRIREAQFEERKLLEAFDWKFNPQIDRLQIEELASGDFIRRQSNLIFVGQAGVGKSHLIQAIGMHACADGYRVLYCTSSGLLTDLTASPGRQNPPATPAPISAARTLDHR